MSTKELSSSSVSKTPNTEERARGVPEKVAGKPPPSGDSPSAGSAAELQCSTFQGKDKNTLEGSAAIASMQASSSSSTGTPPPAGMKPSDVAGTRNNVGPPAFPSSSSNAPPVVGAVDVILLCERCDAVGHTDANCPYFHGKGRERHIDAETRGLGPHCRGNIDCERIMRGTTRGTASGEDCNCLIHTLRQLIDPSAPSTRAKEIRKVLRERFRRGEDRVTADNYLTFDVHWGDIVALLDRDPNNFNITCVDLDFRGHGEVVGNMDESGNEGIIHLYVARENGNHFVPLHKKRFSRLN